MTITTAQIPPEVVEAAKSEYTAHIYKTNASNRDFTAAMCAAIAAALNAWPGMTQTGPMIATVHYNSLILPLPQEAINE